MKIMNLWKVNQSTSIASSFIKYLSLIKTIFQINPTYHNHLITIKAIVKGNERILTLLQPKTTRHSSKKYIEIQ